MVASEQARPEWTVKACTHAAKGERTVYVYGGVPLTGLMLISVHYNIRIRGKERHLRLTRFEDLPGRTSRMLTMSHHCQ